MNKDEVLAFISRHPVFYLATSEGNIPHVRSMGVYRVDEGGIIFHTDKARPLCAQLAVNPEVEMCFSSAQGDFEVRVRGSVEKVEDMELKQRIDPQKPERLAVYRLKNGNATVWAMLSDSRTSTTVAL